MDTFKRQSAHAAGVAQLSVKSRTLGTGRALSGGAGPASDVNTLRFDGGMTCSSFFNPLHHEERLRKWLWSTT